MHDFRTFTESEFLRPMVDGWLGKLALARDCKHRRWWQDNADQSMMFYCASATFMWQPENVSKMFGQLPARPQFRLTIAKAFELVALFGPVIMNRYPTRLARPREPFELPINLFGDQNNPTVQQFYQAMQAEQQQAATEDQIRAALMERWLNYTPREQPHGGLLRNAERGVTAGLIKGRGILWAKDYTMPGSRRVLTGLFEDDPSNLFIDPDATSLDDAKWIAQKCTHPIWWVEREYKLPPGTLRNKGNAESAWMTGEAAANRDVNHQRTNGQTFDQITYFKFWSIGGVGARLSGVSTPLRDGFDQVVGDHAYIVVAPGVPFPLNAPSFAMREWTDEQVKAAFEWPIPFWADDRWPCAVLDFYDKPLSPWPIGPMAAGLGELKLINLFMSFLCSHVWFGARTTYITPKSLEAQFKQFLDSGKDQEVFGLDDPQAQDMARRIFVMQHPQTNYDVWKIIEALMALFDRRTGLTELAYGLNPGGTQPRTAEEMVVKQQALSVRPDYMAHRVEEWLGEGARLEAFVTRWKVDANSVSGLFPPMAQQLWHNLIWSTDVEKVVREMEFSILPGTARKPNKDRDVANISQAMNMLMPMAMNYAGATTDTGPINWLVKKWGEAVDQHDIGQMQFGPWAPPPPPPGAMTPQQMAEMEFQQQMQFKAQDAQLSQQIKLADAQQRMGLDLAKVQQQLGTSQVLGTQKADDAIATSLLNQGIRRAEATQDLRLDQAAWLQDMRQDQVGWQAEMQRQEKQFAADLANKNKLAAVQRKAAARKPAKQGAA